MGKEKVIKFLGIANIALLALFSPVMFFMLLFSISPLTLDQILKEMPLLIMLGGYLWAVIFALLSFNRKYFLVVSFLGWIIFFVGNKIDKVQALNANKNLCSELRKDPNCTESDSDSITCTGNNPGIYVDICN